MTRHLIAIAAFAAALGLGGCGIFKTPEPEIVVVEAEPVPTVKPQECDPKGDPKWKRMPDRALSKSDVSRSDNVNGRAFDKLRGHREACWSVLTASKR